nr:MAG TPA: hypothetical protein [Caudoviricetes sp.]
MSKVYNLSLQCHSKRVAKTDIQRLSVCFFHDNRFCIIFL